MGETGSPREEQREPDVLAAGREGPGTRERWSALPVRLRRALATAACLALLGAGAYAVISHGPVSRPQPTPPSATPSAGPSAQRPPYPAQAARITFTRLRAGDRARREFSIELHAAATSRLTVLLVSQNYEAVDLRLASRAPVLVAPHDPQTLILEGRVTNCDRVPLRARSPFLDVTLRNERARQKLSVIPGERYTRSLTHAFRTLCGSSRAPSAHNP